MRAYPDKIDDDIDISDDDNVDMRRCVIPIYNMPTRTMRTCIQASCRLGVPRTLLGCTLGLYCMPLGASCGRGLGGSRCPLCDLAWVWGLLPLTSHPGSSLCVLGRAWCRLGARLGFTRGAHWAILEPPRLEASWGQRETVMRHSLGVRRILGLLGTFREHL